MNKRSFYTHNLCFSGEKKCFTSSIMLKIICQFHQSQKQPIVDILQLHNKPGKYLDLLYTVTTKASNNMLIIFI